MAALEESGAAFASTDRKRADDNEKSTVAFLLQQEVRLNAAEREQYGRFLAKDFFSKSDFGALNEFYGGAWDKLTEEGKTQMSHRLWEGIRRGEYEFSELPDNVKRREAELIYGLLTNPEKTPEGYQNIPPEDREEFVQQYEAGNLEAAYEILDREGFVENVSKSAERPAIERSVKQIEIGKGSMISQANSRDETAAPKKPVELASAKSEVAGFTVPD